MSKGLEQCDKCDYFISVEEAYQQGRADGARNFAEVLKSQSSKMVQAFIDRQLAEWQKGKDNERV